MVSNLVLIIIGLASVLWIYLVNRRKPLHHHNSLANLPGPEAQSWLKGNFIQALNPKAWGFHLRLLQEFGPTVRHDGLMGDKQLITYDPKAMHHVLVKDQALYERQSLEFARLIFGKGLTGITGEAHRKQRRALNPVFSIAHMKDMLPIFYDVVHKLERGMSRKFESENKPQEIEMLLWMSRTALELVGQAGLGYSFDSLEDDATAHPYPGILKQLITTLGQMWIIRTYVLPWASKIGTPGFQRWFVNTLPWKNGHHVRDMVDYMWEVSKEIYEGKMKALAEGDEAVARQVGKGKDIMSILMRMNTEENENKMEEDEVLGQMSTLVFAAMDTTSSALARVLDLLSTRPDVQAKLRQEILQARKGNEDIPYDVLVSLPYLDAICRETLRLYPPVLNVVRIAKQDTILPLSNPVTGIDGTPIFEVHVPKGSTIMISVLNSNRNPAIWGPDSLEWKPERWLSPLPNDLIEAHIPGVYSHLMTFNAGGRSCIGFKFSQLEMKAVLSMLIAKFNFTPSDKSVFWQMNLIATPSVQG
ncbi:cytochrome P450, partial [Dendrothele bispora CBS 962.96]